MVQTAVWILAVTVAARGAEYISASSPKECPAASVATFTGDCMGASMNTSQLHNDDGRLRSAAQGMVGAEST